jgi:hypothetical protein
MEKWRVTYRDAEIMTIPADHVLSIIEIRKAIREKLGHGAFEIQGAYFPHTIPIRLSPSVEAFTDTVLLSLAKTRPTVTISRNGKVIYTNDNLDANTTVLLLWNMSELSIRERLFRNGQRENPTNLVFDNTKSTEFEVRSRIDVNY